MPNEGHYLTCQSCNLSTSVELVHLLIDLQLYICRAWFSHKLPGLVNTIIGSCRWQLGKKVASKIVAIEIGDKFEFSIINKYY